MKESYYNSHPINTPVLFLVFNRLETTKKVFEAIRQAKPTQFYLASDGARTEEEDKEVQAVRSFILENIDWECEIYTLFREDNLGCKIAVSEAITWFFNNVEKGIVLEDDCLPSKSFFNYCEHMLIEHEYNESVYLISGDSRGSDSLKNMRGDFAFCKYPMIWGWATWSKVWAKYDVNINDWPQNKSGIIQKISKFKKTRRFWLNTFDDVHNGKIDTWDYQLAYLLIKDNARCIIPRINLISNIGFGIKSTHTHDSNHPSANRKTEILEFPIDNKFYEEDEIRINDFFDKSEFLKPTIMERVWKKLLNLVYGK